MKDYLFYLIALLATTFVLNIKCFAQSENSKALTPTPPMGWNSYDSYGTYAHEKACLENLNTFIEVYKPLGYEYFIVDGGWYIEYEFIAGTNFPTTDKGYDVNVNKKGYFMPSNTYFPNGFNTIANKCHANGIKFGIHILRGIPRKAYWQNAPIEGTSYTARDIADTNSICSWNPHTYGIDMNKPGSQAYYDGWIKHLADMGVDFIKADDIVSYPKEIEAVQKAIAKCNKPIVLSLSPGDRVLGSELKLYENANMLRVTGDVWDKQADIDKSFDAWLTWQYVQVRKGFWLDMDMIPFGELQVMIPEKSGTQMAGYGSHRFDNFTTPQKETFITMRAMSASPLMIGGVLPTMDSVSVSLLTNRQMIDCNQNGKTGHMIYNSNYFQIWIAEEGGIDRHNGWIAIFNRRNEKRVFPVFDEIIGLDSTEDYNLFDIWGNKTFYPKEVEFSPNGCLFIRFLEN